LLIETFLCVFDQARIEPLLFRSSIITSEDALRSLVERVVAFQSHTNPTCRDWIRELRIEEFDYQDEEPAPVLQHLNLVHILIANALSLE
jgi:hypothetical protein